MWGPWVIRPSCSSNLFLQFALTFAIAEPCLAHVPAAVNGQSLPRYVLIHRQHHSYRATSSTEPKCPIGIRLGLAFGLLVTMSVSIRAGAIAFTVMPSRTNAEAHEWATHPLFHT
jgi:hypothetical protein